MFNYNLSRVFHDFIAMPTNDILSSLCFTVLQMFLTSAKPTIRFAAVKTLNRIAMIHPDAVTSCNVDLENLISDSNRSIATLAITTLLKVSCGVHQLEIGHQLFLF